jgi:hypothetical protein
MTRLAGLLCDGKSKESLGEFCVLSRENNKMFLQIIIDKSD